MVSALFGQDVGLDGKAHYLKSQIPNSRKEDNLQRQLRKNIVTVSSVNRSKVHAQFQVILLEVEVFSFDSARTVCTFSSRTFLERTI